jgi:hypothetical protein
MLSYLPMQSIERYTSLAVCGDRVGSARHAEAGALGSRPFDRFPSDGTARRHVGQVLDRHSAQQREGCSRRGRFLLQSRERDGDFAGDCVAICAQSRQLLQHSKHEGSSGAHDSAVIRHAPFFSLAVILHVISLAINSIVSTTLSLSATNLKVQGHTVRTHTTMTRPMRGAGNPEAISTIEYMLDRAADAVGIHL